MSHMLQSPNFKMPEHKKISHDFVNYSKNDHATWSHLYTMQENNLKDLAHPKVLGCLEKIALPKENIPQLKEISDRLCEETGWQISRVEDLIDSYEFFELLSNRIFPSTVYIRNSKELSLSRDPDIFHELFGHCPILLDKSHADLFQKFGILGLKLDEIERKFLQRLFWFTFETGLIMTNNGLKIYGGSLLSSIQESRYSITDTNVPRKSFDLISVFRTPYRADLLQGIYYIIQNFSQLYTILDDSDLIRKKIEIAYNLGEFLPSFPVEEKFEKYINYNICKTRNNQQRAG